MRQISIGLTLIGCLLLFAGCMIRIEFDLFGRKHAGMPAITVVTPTAETPKTPTAEAPKTPTAEASGTVHGPSITPFHAISVQPDMTSTVTGTHTAVGTTWLVDQQDWHTNSIGLTSIPTGFVQLALTRIVTDTNQPPPLTSAAKPDWVLFMVSTDPNKAEHCETQPWLWSETNLGPAQTVSSNTVSTNPMAVLQYPIQRVCWLPERIAWQDLLQSQKTAANLLGVKLWTDAALFSDTNSEGRRTNVLHAFARVQQQNAPGGQSQHDIYCAEIGCPSGSSGTYCWLKGC